VPYEQQSGNEGTLVPGGAINSNNIHHHHHDDDNHDDDIGPPEFVTDAVADVPPPAYNQIDFSDRARVLVPARGLTGPWSPPPGGGGAAAAVTTASYGGAADYVGETGR
jgi:hypothetical protein